MFVFTGHPFSVVSVQLASPFSDPPLNRFVWSVASFRGVPIFLGFALPRVLSSFSPSHPFCTAPCPYYVRTGMK